MMFNEMEAMVNFLNSSEGNNTPAWQAAMRDLNALMEAMKPYQTQDEATKTYPTISQEEYERIDRLFDAAVTSTNIYSKEESNDIHDTVRIQLTKNLKKATPIRASTMRWSISVTKTSSLPTPIFSASART